MSDAYNDALSEQMKKNVWDQLKSEAANMSKLEYASVAADIAGIFDPTPISDGAGLLLSVAQLDGWGVLLSLGSMVPYVGDTLAKPLKIAKRAPRTARALEAFMRASDNLAQAGGAALKRSGLSLKQVAAARKQALERVQKAMLDCKNKMPGWERCQLKLGGPRKLQMPESGKHGKWQTPGGAQPASGNGIFKFDEPKQLPDGRTVKEIEFRNGAPNFDKYVEGPKYDLWEVSGNAKTDGDRLAAMMREKNPNWQPPSKKHFVLHHFEDGKVGYIPRTIHDRAIGGAGHTGGNSMINNELF